MLRDFGETSHVEAYRRQGDWKETLPVATLIVALHGVIALALSHAWITPPRPLPVVQVSFIGPSAVHHDLKKTPTTDRQPKREQRETTPKADAQTLAVNQIPRTPPIETASPANSTASPDAYVEPVFHAAYLNNTPPAYPWAARRRNQQGTVIVHAEILSDGSCHQALIKKASGYALLDEAALGAVKKWRFVPAKRGTQAITAWVDVPITFRLNSAK